MPERRFKAYMHVERMGGVSTHEMYIPSEADNAMTEEELVRLFKMLKDAENLHVSCLGTEGWEYFIAIPTAKMKDVYFTSSSCLIEK